VIGRGTAGVAGALAIALAGCQPAVIASPAPTTAAVSPTPLIANGWTLVGLPEVGDSWYPGGAIADGTGFVIYGGVDQRPAAWTSDDGRAWTPVALPGFGGFPSEAAWSPVATVLVGVGGMGRCAHPSGELIWRRLAGQSDWQLAPFEDILCAGGIPRVAAGATAFVVAGSSAGDSSFAWVSPDGLRWMDESLQLPVSAPPLELTWTGTQFLALGGFDVQRAYTSIDGSKWKGTQAPPEAPPFPAVPVPAVGKRAVALLATAKDTVAFYESDDATAVSEWQRQGDGSWRELQPSGLEPGDAIRRGVVLEGRPFLFVSRPSGAELVTSADLATWTSVSIPEVSGIEGLATFGGRAILVASVADPAGGQDRSMVFVTDIAALR
jgi:hypothetical protein